MLCIFQFEGKGIVDTKLPLASRFSTATNFSQLLFLLEEFLSVACDVVLVSVSSSVYCPEELPLLQDAIIEMSNPHPINLLVLIFY